MPERHPSSQRFHDLLAEIGALHDKKQADYGSDNDPFANVRASERWGLPAWAGALLRASDKVARLQNFARKGKLANESAEDSMLDVAVYALIAKVLYEEASTSQQKTMREALDKALIATGEQPLHSPVPVTDGCACHPSEAVATYTEHAEREWGPSPYGGIEPRPMPEVEYSSTEQWGTEVQLHDRNHSATAGAYHIHPAGLQGAAFKTSVAEGDGEHRHC